MPNAHRSYAMFLSKMSSRFLVLVSVFLMGTCVSLPRFAEAQPPSPAPASKGAEKPKSIGGFGEAPRGDVPEGTLELMTAETDKSIRAGLAWLAQRRSRTARTGRGRIGGTSR